MLQHKSALYLCLAVTLIYAANAGQLPRYTPPQYYHYPTPRRQLTIPVAVPQQQQQYTRYAQQTNYVQQQQQQQQQYQPTNSYYQQQVQQAANVVQKFSAPALENVAFTSALTNQGYTYGGNGHASTISAARALPSALTLPASIAAEVAAADESNANAAAAGAIDSSDSSVNLKLPLPINIAPIKVQPLPLQAGASFSELANAVTSYGTVYPQRKRR